jgi:hypothetical protein
MAPIDVRLRPLLESDESAVRQANRVMAAEHFPFAFDLGPTTQWSCARYVLGGDR